MLIGYQHMLRIRLYKYEIPRFDFPCYESLIMQYFEYFYCNWSNCFCGYIVISCMELYIKRNKKSNDLPSNICKHREHITWRCIYNSTPSSFYWSEIHTIHKNINTISQIQKYTDNHCIMNIIPLSYNDILYFRSNF